MAQPRRRRPRRRRPRRRLPPRAARYARSVRPPDGADLFFRMALRRLVKAWAIEVRRRVLPRAERIGRADASEIDDTGLADFGSRLAHSRDLTRAITATADRTEKHSKGEFKRLGIKLREAEPKLDEAIKAWRKENIERVESLFENEAKRLEKILGDGEGRRVESLAKEIEERIDISARQAELLARDQVLTLNAQITRARQRAAGIRRFTWTTAGDERVRPSHEELDGKTFDYDDPPIVDGVPALPGEPPLCRCVAFPELPELEEDAE